jgi:hypothetical protein
MPTHRVLEEWARRVEREMSPHARKEARPPTERTCPICEAKNPRDAPDCGECGHEFPPRPRPFKSCEECRALNLMAAENCQSCGHSFRLDFQITLNEALRVDAIVRGMDLDEDEVRDGEQHKAEILANVLGSGDDALIKVIKQLPEESWGRLRKIRRVALSRDGLLRLVPAAPWRRVARTLSAVDVLEGRVDGGRLAGALVLLGGSAPELGGLRKTPADPLTPSVQIQADAVEQMVAGRVPRTLAAAAIMQPLTVLMIGVVAALLGAALSPVTGSAILTAAIAVSGLADRLVDPLPPSIAAVLVFMVTASTAYSLRAGGRWSCAIGSNSISRRRSSAASSNNRTWSSSMASGVKSRRCSLTSRVSPRRRIAPAPRIWWQRSTSISRALPAS